MSGGLKRLEHLAWSVSGSEQPCPIPSSHDRLLETHFFLHEMARNYHDPDPFRYCLHAFIQAIESVLDMLLMETQNDSRFVAFRENRKALLARDEMQKLRSVRNAAVHRESLVPDSRVSVGWFKYGKPKLCLQMQINPLISSLEVMMRFRNNPTLVNLLRMWEGEEVGVMREWRLRSAGEAELLTVCAERFSEVSALVSEAHVCAGAHFPGGQCDVAKDDFQTMLESSYFPEVYKAWEGAPMDTIISKADGLILREAPWDSSEILHRVSKGSEIKGWVGSHPLWERVYLTALVLSIDGVDVKENTAVFIKESDVAVRLAENSSEE